MTTIGLVDITDTTPAFFITTAVFLLYILSMFSLGVLQSFQQKFRRAIVSFVAGLLGTGVFVYVVLTKFQ